MKKYANILGWAGLALIVIGLVIYSINSLLNTFNTVVLVAGVVLMAAFTILKFKEIKTGLTSRSAKFSTNAALMVLVVLGILIVINILAARFSARVDTTAAKMYSLADQTRQVLGALDQDVNVTGFFKAGEEGRLEELLTEYAHYSQRLNFKFVDPDKKPGEAKKYNITSYGAIVVQSGPKTEKINEVAEEALTNAIITVTREGVKKIYFTTGHGERDFKNTQQNGYSTARDAIEDENYEIGAVMLAAADTEVPDDCSVLVVAGPKTPLFENEVEKIKAFLKKGGKVLLMADTDAPADYTALAADLGIEIGNDIIVDVSGIGQLFGAGPTMPIVSNYGDHAIVNDFGGMMTIFPEARSVRKASPPSEVTVTEVAKTTAQSWAETGDLATGEVAFDQGQDRQGPITVLAVAEKEAENPPETEDQYGLGGEAKTRFAVFGDADFASNSYFNVQGNSDLFLNTLSWLAEEEDLISVRAKDPEDRRLNITQKQSKIMLWVGVILLPLLIFILGVVVYRRRR